nr:MAG TPA: hypothetical protein [Caudoviricetes sp.]
MRYDANRKSSLFSRVFSLSSTSGLYLKSFR